MYIIHIYIYTSMGFINSPTIMLVNMFRFHDVGYKQKMLACFAHWIQKNYDHRDNFRTRHKGCYTENKAMHSRVANIYKTCLELWTPWSAMFWMLFLHSGCHLCIYLAYRHRIEYRLFSILRNILYGLIPTCTTRQRYTIILCTCTYIVHIMYLSLLPSPIGFYWYV